MLANMKNKSIKFSVLAKEAIKMILHYLFLYKAKLRPGWQLIPE